MKSPSERRPCRTTVVAAAPHCSRRHALAASAAATAAFCGLSAASPLRGSSPVAIAADDLTTVPQTAAELWALFDPRQDPLETELIREWQADGLILRHVRFLVGHFRDTAARLTAIYGFPANAPSRQLPGVLHIHGGGQRGSLSEVRFLAGRGYAGLSISWGGSSTGQPPINPVEGAMEGDPATDWGLVNPTQLNVPGYATIQPGPQQFRADIADPRNNNWYLLTAGCQRALTFLEQQPEVDPERLGIHGYSMGGNLTMYTAAADRRVRVAVPAVGGAGWRWQLPEFAEGQGRPQDVVTGDLELFRRTLSFESIAPLIRCPLLHRSATNDFHGWMDNVSRTNALIPDQPVRSSWTIHMNHRLAESTEVALPLFLDQHLRNGPAIPEPAEAELRLSTGAQPILQVTLPQHPWTVDRCEMFYSVDPDPRARFWRSTRITDQTATAAKAATRYEAVLPLETLERPLFAFANVFYRLPEPVDLSELPGHREPVTQLCLSSQLLTATANDLQSAGTVATLQHSPLIDDFSAGLRDWYQLNAAHPTLVQTWTRKLTDPLFQGRAGARLRLSLQLEHSNHLTFVIVRNEWRNYRGPRTTWICERDITGNAAVQNIEFSTADFLAADGSADSLPDWTSLDQFGICAHFSERRSRTDARPWQGPAVNLKRLEWC